MKIQVNHIGKMEGHTDFVAEILRGDVKDILLEIRRRERSALTQVQ